MGELTHQTVRDLCDRAPWRRASDGPLTTQEAENVDTVRAALLALYTLEGWKVCQAFCDYATDLDPDGDRGEFWAVMGPWLSASNWRHYMDRRNIERLKDAMQAPGGGVAPRHPFEDTHKGANPCRR